MHPADAALTEHNPRPAGDPYYVPWWARGEYAARNGTKFVLPDGTIIASGRIVTKGHGRRLEAQRVYQPRPDASNATETPRSAPEVPSKAPRAPDRAQGLWAECNGRLERAALLQRHGIDPSILDNAPNPGVASMRGLNALRKVLNG